LGTELDKATQAQLDRGARLVELLKQPQYKPMPVEQEVMMIYAGTQSPEKGQPGYLDDVPIIRVQDFQNTFLAFIDSNYSGLRKNLADQKTLTPEFEADLKKALLEFKSRVWKK